MTLRKLAQVSVNVRDLPRAVAFYRDAPPQMAFFDCGGVHLRFSSPVHKVARRGDRDLYMAFFDDTEGDACALSEERA